MNDEPVPTETIEAERYQPPTITTQILKGSDMVALHVDGYKADTYYLVTITNHMAGMYVDSVDGETSINIRLRELSDWELSQFKKALGIQ